MKKNFMIEVPEEKSINIMMFDLARKADIRWSIVKDKLIGPKLTWSKFLEELRAKFYPITIQWEKKKEFSELRMIGSTSVMQYASKIIELSQFILDFVASERMKMRTFKEGLTFYIRHQLAAPPIHTY